MIEEKQLRHPSELEKELCFFFPRRFAFKVFSNAKRMREHLRGLIQRIREARKA